MPKGSQRDRLRDIVATKSLKKGGPFTLASGAVSNYYFNLKETTLDPEGSLLIADLILQALAELPCDYVGGLEMGAVPIAACVAMRSAQIGKPMPAFYVRKEVKGHGTKRRIDVDLRKGARVAVVEDVTTSGGSALVAIEAVREIGCVPAAVVAVLDREEGASAKFAAAGIPFRALLTAGDFDLG